MKFAFYKAHRGFLDALIRWWEDGMYSHCEAILSENQDGTYTIASSKPGLGMRITTQTLPESDWDIIESPGNVETVTEWFTARTGLKYDWLGIFGMVIRPVKGDLEKRYFCSEAIAEALGIGDPWRYDPNALYYILVALQKTISLK